LRTITSEDLKLLSRGNDKPFTSFVDALVRAQGFVYGVADAEILTNLRTHVPDAGVDTQVRQAVPNEETGYFQVPSCWQYKARLFKDVKNQLKAEISKEYTRSLIQQGYGYRLAICDEVPATEIAEWEAILTAEARSIDGDAHPVRIATAGQLAIWANRYPAALAGHLYRSNDLPFLCFDAWSETWKTETPHFVPIANWNTTEQQIKQHLRWSQRPLEPIVTLQGWAGVGKTRLVFEVAHGLEAGRELVCYTIDEEKATDLIYTLVNNREQRAIVIADECSAEVRAKIAKKVRGHEHRIRVICIDNSGQMLPSGSEELWLRELPNESVQAILDRNFLYVPFDRRLAYAKLSGGYIRFAAYLCRHHERMGSLDDLGVVLDLIEQDLRGRLTERDWKALYAISLVQRVGHSQDVAAELDDLCALTRLDRDSVLDSCYRLKDSPGFLAMTSRYVYVTPEIIAQIALQQAWQRFASLNPHEFLQKFPASLLSSFQSRVRQSGSEEVRRFVSGFFWNAVREMTPQQLADPQVFKQFAILVETDPERNFSVLRRLVELASVEELRATGGDHWGESETRRLLVMLSQEAAAFPQYFSDAERILRRLALVETEPQNLRNATGTWSRLFRLFLSDTAVPFPERLEILKSLAASSQREERQLVLKALSELFNERSTSVIRTSLFAGQLIPSEWKPNNREEIQQHFRSALNLLGHVLSTADAMLQEQAWDILLTALRLLLRWHLITDVQKLISEENLSEQRRAKLLEELENYLQYECNGGESTQPQCAAVQAWIAQLTPTDFVKHLKTIVAKDQWRQKRREYMGDVISPMPDLAAQLLSHPEELKRLLAFLGSPEARSAGLLGQELGMRDVKGKYLDVVIESAKQAQSTAFARSYITGLLSVSSAQAKRVNEHLDKIEASVPRAVFDLALEPYQHTDPIARTLRMVKADQLPVEFLGGLYFGKLLQSATAEELVAIFHLLIRTGNDANIGRAVDMIGSLLHDAESHWPAQFADPSVPASLWNVLEAAALSEDREDFWWREALQRCFTLDPGKAINIAVLAIADGHYHKREAGWQLLQTWADVVPEAVMNAIGSEMLDPEKGWQLLHGQRKPLFHTLPLQIVLDWVEGKGMAAARAVASHLDPPFLNGNNEPAVPELTLVVLERWGQDKEVFSNFCLAAHQLQARWGSIADNYLEDAEIAEKFLHHPSEPIRRWAEREYVLATEQARAWKVRMEEESLPK